MNAIRWLLSHDIDVITSSCGYAVFNDYEHCPQFCVNGNRILL